MYTKAARTHVWSEAAPWRYAPQSASYPRSVLITVQNSGNSIFTGEELAFNFDMACA